MSITFKVESSALDLCWILKLIATLWKSTTVNRCMTVALLSQEHHQNLLPIFAPVTHDLIAVPASQANVRHAFSVCSDIRGGPKDGLF